MKYSFGLRLSCATAVAVALVLAVSPASPAATKSVDLDGDATTESRCDLNVLSTFPARIENVVTNAAIGEGFEFSWLSAGPGGFSGSVPAGTAEGVGAVWTWATNETVISFTGGSCETDICFLQTDGTMDSSCTDGCEDDGVTLTVSRDAAGATVLDWSGGDPTYSVFQSPRPGEVRDPANLQLTTGGLQFTDGLSGNATTFYLVRASSCLTAKACTSNDDCNAGEGTCVSRGPFSVPGRTLSAGDITVSSSSLTSSIITFFSPRQEVFRITCTAQPGGSFETLKNLSTEPQVIEVDEFPLGCCPADPEVPNQLRCDEECVDYLNDPQNCGECGNVCGEGDCCSNGNCVSTCPAGQVLCDGQCVDLQNDSANCGACGEACLDGSCCNDGQCTSFCDPGDTYCDESGLCANLSIDPTNCGECGHACEIGDCCSDGQCIERCPSGRTFCPEVGCVNLRFDDENCGECGNACDSDSFCHYGNCLECDDVDGTRSGCGVNAESPTLKAQRSECPEEDFPEQGVCPNPDSSWPSQPACPNPGPPAPQVEEAPICQANPVEPVFIPPGGEVTVCRPGGLLFREVSTTLSVCGDGIPGPDGTCGVGVASTASGTFNRFVPDTETEVGQAFVTPFAVHVDDSTRDGLLGAEEDVSLLIDVLNAGPVDIVDATATIIADPIDLSNDGIDNPLAMTIVNGTSSYGTIPGTVPSVECEPVQLQPATNLVPFQITVPADHPGDTSHLLVLRFTGTVDGEPFEMDMPINLGVADRCDIANNARDFDVLDGLHPPLARLVPEGDAVPFPTAPFMAGEMIPLQLRQACGIRNLRDEDIDAPEIVGLSEATLGELDVLSLDLNDNRAPGDVFFSYDRDRKAWTFNLRTTDLAPGSYTIEIRIGDRKNYLTGFELQ